jgi:dihydrofolate reductase
LGKLQADKMNGMPKYVVSSTLTDPAWNNTTVITLDEAGKLRDQYQGDILVAGSGQLDGVTIQRYTPAKA